MLQFDFLNKMMSGVLHRIVLLAVVFASANCYMRRLYKADIDEPFILDEDVILKLIQLDTELEEISEKDSLANFNYLINMTEDNSKIMNELSIKKIEVVKKVWREASALKDACKSCAPKWRRMLSLMSSNRGISALNKEKLTEFDHVKERMETNYATAKVCDLPGYKNECLSLDPDLEELLRSHGNYCLLTNVWKKWRDVSGKKVRDDFTRFVELYNEAARLNGYENGKEMWLESFTQDNPQFSEELLNLWEELKPLYQEFHAYVRSKLIDLYGKDKFPQSGHIPAQLFGNMWGQSWDALINLVQPYPETGVLDITDSLRKKKANVTTMVEYADDFYQSLGMDPMTQKFWKNSVFEKKPGVDMVCHASASNIKNNGDYRIKMCGSVNTDNFQTVHHEMGHIQYYMHYAHEYYTFRGSANPGFHEALGDAMAISAMNPLHLKALGLLSDKDLNDENEEKVLLNSAMLRALFKLAVLPWTLLVDVFRLNVFTGDIRPENYNEEWWTLRCGLQGLSPPVHRSEADFDPGAKYHINSASKYISYFVATILQFDFHESICRRMGFEKDFHKCNIYDNPRAAFALREMMALGKSRPYPEILKVITGGRSRMSAGPMLRFFEPLRKWMAQQNRRTGVKVGWDESKCPAPVYIC